MEEPCWSTRPPAEIWAERFRWSTQWAIDCGPVSSQSWLVPMYDLFASPAPSLPCARLLFAPRFPVCAHLQPSLRICLHRVCVSVHLASSACPMLCLDFCLLSARLNLENTLAQCLGGCPITSDGDRCNGHKLRRWPRLPLPLRKPLRRQPRGQPLTP